MWLVLEKWIDEMPFKNTYAEDETWLARELNQNELKERLTKHRETFITEKDFKIISGKYGLNMVRIPVPYFIFGDRNHLSDVLNIWTRHLIGQKNISLRLL